MAAPTAPVVEPVAEGDELDYNLTIELSQAQVAALSGTSDAIFEMPASVNIDPDLFSNPMKITVSVQQPWVPFP